MMHSDHFRGATCLAGLLVLAACGGGGSPFSPLHCTAGATGSQQKIYLIRR